MPTGVCNTTSNLKLSKCHASHECQCNFFVLNLQISPMIYGQSSQVWCQTEVLVAEKQLFGVKFSSNQMTN